MESMTHPFLIPLESHTDFRGSNIINFDAFLVSKLPSFHAVQINTAYSETPYTLRGLHYQEEPYAQAKLCWVLRGSVFKVALNLTTGEVTTAELRTGTAMYIPKGYARGYLTLCSHTIFQWAVDEDFNADFARVVNYNSCGIQWPVDKSEIVIWERDKNVAALTMT